MSWHIKFLFILIKTKLIIGINKCYSVWYGLNMVIPVLIPVIRKYI